MRILITFFLLTVSYSAFSQTKTDSLNLLEQKVSKYLDLMYRQQNFDSAFQMWDKKMLLEIRDSYEKENKQNIEGTLLIDTLKAEYRRYYNASKKYTFTNFNEKDITKEGNNVIGLFNYSFIEELNGKPLNSYSLIYLVFDEEFATWRILDFKTLWIINDPNKWNK